MTEPQLDTDIWPFNRGVVEFDATTVDVIDYISGSAVFAADPAYWVSHAAARAADAETNTGFNRDSDRIALARFWTHIACGLVYMADSPHCYRGAVLDGLVERYGDGLIGSAASGS